MTAVCIDHPAPTRSLRSDTSGAVMFMGIFMGVSMIGTLFAMIGIGKAIVLREGVQQAADSAAFSSSVMQARGLNVVQVDISEYEKLEGCVTCLSVRLRGL